MLVPYIRVVWVWMAATNSSTNGPKQNVSISLLFASILDKVPYVLLFALQKSKDANKACETTGSDFSLMEPYESNR